MSSLFHFLIQAGLLGSVISMLQFSKYCRLLKQGWALDPETAKRYQAKAQRWLSATVCLIGMSVVSMFLALLFH